MTAQLTALQTLLEKIKSLNEKRTPGSWFESDGERILVDITNYPNDALGVVAEVFDPSRPEHSYQTKTTNINAQFIATVANECAKLVKIIEVQSEALKHYEKSFWEEFSETEVARSALEQAEKIAEGKE